MLASLNDPDPHYSGDVSPPAPTSPAHGPLYFQAPDYTHWTVHEVRDPTTNGGRSLIFVSATGFRRVRDYPTGWRALSADDLWALSWQR